MKFKLAAVAAAVAATMALAACGGGGGNSGFIPPIAVAPPPPPPAPPPPPPAPPAPAPAPAPATSTFMYEQLPPAGDRAGFLADLNAEGARGFRFLAPLSNNQPPGSANVYVKPGDATYVYELTPAPTDANTFLNDANAAGARGFRWVGTMSAGGSNLFMYRKDSDTSATFTYRLEAAAADRTGYVARGNAQGSEGFYNVAPAYSFGTALQAIFEKSSLGNSTFTYEVADAASDEAGLLAQLDEKGGRGFRFRGPYSYGNIYARDASQSSTFSYQTQVPEAAIADLLQQANAQGANGYGFVGQLGAGGVSKIYYYKPVNCTGPALCMPTGPFGP